MGVYNVGGHHAFCLSEGLFDARMAIEMLAFDFFILSATLPTLHIVIEVVCFCLRGKPQDDTLLCLPLDD